MKYTKCDVLGTGYGWITPDGGCIEVQDPSLITESLKKECGWIRPFYNTSNSRDAKFFYELHNFIYSHGYVRVSKHRDTLAIEGDSMETLSEHVDLIEAIRNKCSYRGNALKLKKFVAAVGDIRKADNPTRNLFFPRQ